MNRFQHLYPRYRSFVSYQTTGPRWLRQVALLVLLLAAPSTRLLADTPLVETQLQTFDLNGHQITSIQPGQHFQLRLIAYDLRTPVSQALGVFAAFANISYDGQQATIGGSITAGPQFDVGRAYPSGNTSVVGAVSGAGDFINSLTPVGNAPEWVITVPFQANHPGTVDFQPTFDSTDGDDTLIFGDNFAVPADQILFVGTTLTVVPEPATAILFGGGACLLLASGRFRRRSVGRRHP